MPDLLNYNDTRLFETTSSIRKPLNSVGLGFGMVALIVTLLDIRGWKNSREGGRRVMRVQLYTLFLVIGDLCYNIASLLGTAYFMDHFWLLVVLLFQ